MHLSYRAIVKTSCEDLTREQQNALEHGWHQNIFTLSDLTSRTTLDSRLWLTCVAGRSRKTQDGLHALGETASTAGTGTLGQRLLSLHAAASQLRAPLKLRAPSKSCRASQIHPTSLQHPHVPSSASCNVFLLTRQDHFGILGCRTDTFMGSCKYTWLSC